MNYEIKQEDKRTVAGFHLVGPWEPKNYAATPS